MARAIPTTAPASGALGGELLVLPRNQTELDEAIRRSQSIVTRRAALASALSLRASEKAVSIVDGLAFDAPKTATIAGVLKALGLHDKRTLLVIGAHDENLWRSCRNIRNQIGRAHV